MSGLYLIDLADVVRSLGLQVVEQEGWRGRAAGRGGYAPGRPDAVMVHHTASPPSSDGQRDADYITHGAQFRPLSNLYLNRSGVVWVCAAGTTNTNGAGGPLADIPADSMNAHALAIEAANRGTGEPWPEVQQDALITLVPGLCRHYRVSARRVWGHFEWAPGRKIDPAGPSRWAPQGGSWRMDAFRADVERRLAPPPITTPERTIDMYNVSVRKPGWPSEVWLRVGADSVTHIVSGTEVDVDTVFGVPKGALTEAQVEQLLRGGRRTWQPSPFVGQWADTEMNASWEAARR